MVVWNVLGCKFGTGVGAVACQPRTNRATDPHRLGDIFHSNPVVVGRPPGTFTEPSYVAFAAERRRSRDQVIMAGANDGVFRIFDAGTWQTPAAPAEPGLRPGHGRRARGLHAVRRAPEPEAARARLGQPRLLLHGRLAGGGGRLDVLEPDQLEPGDEDRAQWKTIVMAGLRQGGNSYFALDVTDPDAVGYPGYLWEFPRENDPAAITNTMGQTWSEPVITKVKVAVNGDLANPQERWVAIFAGGYDRTGDPNTGFYNVHATAGRSLTMLDMKTGQILAQKKFVDTPAVTDPATATYSSADPGAQHVLRDADDAGRARPRLRRLRRRHLRRATSAATCGSGSSATSGTMRSTAATRAPRRTAARTARADSRAGTSGSSSRRRPYPAPPAAGPRHYRSFFFSPAATLKNNVLWLAFGSGERANLSYPGITTDTGENNRFYSIKDLDPFQTRRGRDADDGGRSERRHQPERGDRAAWTSRPGTASTSRAPTARSS